MQTFNGPLLNGTPVNGAGQTHNSRATLSASAIPSAEGLQNLFPTLSYHLSKQHTPTNAGNKQTHVQISPSFSLLSNGKQPAKVNVHAAKSKHRRLNNFNAIRHDNTVVCGPNGPIVDPRVNPNGVSGDLPHKRWPYASRSKPKFNSQTINSHQPVNQPVNSNFLHSQTKPVSSNITFANGHLMPKNDLHILPTHFGRQHKITNNEVASLQQQDFSVHKTLASVSTITGSTEKSKLKNCILVMVADMETQTEEEYFSTPLNGCNLSQNSHTLVPDEVSQINDQTEPLVKEKLPEHSSNIEHIKPVNPTTEEPRVLARIPRIKISNLQNKNKLVARLVDDDTMDTSSQTVTKVNEAQENCDTINDSDSESSSETETFSSESAALLPESALAAEPCIETVRTSLTEENDNHNCQNDSPIVSPTVSLTVSPNNSSTNVTEQDVIEANVNVKVNLTQVKNTAVNPTMPEDQPVKRKPGRPRKTPIDAPKPSIFPKRGRGRPRKYPLVVIEKKGRGRPRKNPQV